MSSFHYTTEAQRKSETYKVRFLLLIGFVLLAAASRFLPFPPNFAPIMAMALFAGACFANKRYAFFVPIAAMFLSDLAIGLFSGNILGGFHNLMPVVYLSFALIVCLGFWLKGRRRLAPIAGATLAGSILFFVVTNFSVWAFGTMYPKTLEGLGACFVAAIPFFQNSLAGDMFFVAALFGGLALAEKCYPALRVGAPAARVVG